LRFTTSRLAPDHTYFVDQNGVAVWVHNNCLVDQLNLPKDVQRALLRDALNTNGTGLIAHHLIPLQAFSEYPELLEKAAGGGFNINGAKNGIPLIPFIEHYGFHPIYNRSVLDALDNISTTLSPEDTAAAVQDVADTYRQAIDNDTFGPWG
jgi:hypothetical protein